MSTEKLRDFLCNLSPEARRTLVHGLEEAIARGERDPNHKLILTLAREAFLRNQPPIARIGTAKRVFYKPLEPFLISEVLPQKQRSRIHRASLDPIWNWIERDLAKDRVAGAIHDLEKALDEGEASEVEAAARALRARVLAVVREYLAALLATPEGHRRLSGHLGGQRVLDDLRDMVDIFEAERALSAFLKGIAEHVIADRRSVEPVKGAFANFVRVEPGKAVFALAALTPRFDPPEDFLRFVVEAVGSDDLAAVIRSDYAPAIELTLTEISRLIERFSKLPRSVANIAAIQGTVRQYHRWIRTFEVVFEVGPSSEWGRRLAEFRSTMATRVASLIEPAPILARRALRPVRTERGLQPPDQDVVAEALVAVSLLDTAGTARDSLALNRLLPETRKSVEQVVETMTNGIIAELKGCSEGERQILTEYADTGISLSAAVFGDDYAAVIRRGRSVALHQQQAVAR